MDKITKSTPKNIIDLYTKIPDYSEVKHLGNSEFINTVERLKEEFRQIRSSLYEESDLDVELITEKTAKVLNVRENSNRPAVNYLSSRCNSGGNYFYTTTNTTTAEPSNIRGLNNSNNSQYLAVKSCHLHRSPFAAAATATVTGTTAQNFTTSTPKSRSPYHYNSSKFLNQTSNYESKLLDSGFRDQDDDVDEILSLTDESVSARSESGTSSPLSRWSSNPEISKSRSSWRQKEYVPPANTQNRLLQRKPQNRSEPALVIKPEESSNTLKVHPVPAHVKKLLFDKIMTNNKKRSQRVREMSKQRLLSQVKPFSFTKRNGKTSLVDQRTSHTPESLNNTKPVKSRKQNNFRNFVKTNNNNFDGSTTRMFRANPAPPRSKALLAAIRLREQQEYRELKKRLRSETLMKTASLPPSMAARDKETKENQSRLQTILNKLENTTRLAKNRNRWRRERSVSSSDTSFTDDDRISDTSLPTKKEIRSRVTTIVEPFNFSNEGKPGSSVPGLRYAGITTGVFESTSNDNNASRLRVMAAKRKEDQRLKREEEEQLRLMRIENARQNLRDSKLQVWRRACSYSSSQDIAMRRQLRAAASILERQAFQKDMSTMLNRVRSAPLLLEGVRERRFEPCKKHLEEMQHLTDRSSKFNTPRTGKSAEKYCTRMNWTSRCDGPGDHCGTEFSETAALAEGTNSDNESVKNIELDSDEDEDKEHGPKSHSHSQSREKSEERIEEILEENEESADNSEIP